MRAVDGIAQILKREGVQYIFNYPFNTLIEACAATGIRPIVCRQERVGMGMADGYSRINNGQPFGVFTSQHGPGGENAFAGVATAFSDSTPVLILPFGDNTDRAGVSRVFSAALAFERVSKSSEVLNRSDRTGEVMRRALNALRTGRPGPVVVEIPDDVGVEEIDEASLNFQPVKPIKSSGDPADIDVAAKALLEAKCPVIFVGQGVRFAAGTNALVELAELLQAPVMTTLLGKGSFPEGHPLSAGTASGVGPGTVPHFLAKGDVFLVIGSSLTRHRISSVAIPDGKTLIQVTNDPSDLNKEYSLDYGVVGDAQLVIRQFIEAISERLGSRARRIEAGPIAAEIQAVRESWMQQWLPKLTSDEVPINPYRVVWEMIKAFDPASSILTHDSGSPRSQLVPFWQASTNGYIGFGKSHALGSGLGLIMGAKLAAPEKLCVNWMGDGAFGMVGTDFETASRNEIPILTIVSNNSELAVETARMKVSHGLYETRKTTGNYADMARAMGGYSEQIEKPAEIAAALERAKRATESGQAALLEFITSAETMTSSAQPG